MKENINRRRFLRYTATGGAGLFLSTALPGQSKETPAAPPAKPDKPVFEVRPLGKTGIKLPILSMGVMRADNPNLVKAALRQGVVHIDTANVYQKGNNETMLGKVLKGVPRDSFVISTKIKLDRDTVSENGPALFMEKFNQSMARLELDYVDILYLHAVDDPSHVLHEPMLEVFRKLKKEGRIKHCGVSTHNNEVKVIDAAIETKVYDIVLTAYNFTKGPAIKSAVARAASAGLGVVAMKTMAGAKNINIPAALKWALQDKNVTTAIPGFSDFDQLDVCLEAAANIAYTPSEKAFIDKANTVATLYCQGCNQCAGQCPQNLPIPDLMRAYMYAHGYRNPALAKETIADLSLPDNPCADCGACTVRCASNFSVAAKIQDISRIRNVPDEFLV